jgi:hypothetical protein
LLPGYTYIALEKEGSTVAVYRVIKISPGRELSKYMHKNVIPTE